MAPVHRPVVKQQCSALPSLGSGPLESHPDRLSSPCALGNTRHWCKEAGPSHTQVLGTSEPESEWAAPGPLGGLWQLDLRCVGDAVSLAGASAYVGLVMASEPGTHPRLSQDEHLCLLARGQIVVLPLARYSVGTVCELHV